MPADKVPKVTFGFTADCLTGNVGLALVAKLVKLMSLPEFLVCKVRSNRRKRGKLNIIIG